MALLTAHQLLSSVAAAGWGFALALAAARRAPRRRWGTTLRTVAAFLALFGAIGAFHLNPSSIREPGGQAHATLVLGLLVADIALTLRALRRAPAPVGAVDD